MFPSDANNDGVANQFDVLPIGVAFGMEGFPRPGASLLWQPQFFQPWLQNLPVSNINLGFADGNGDGLIDTLDLDPVALNFDSTQNAAQPSPHPYLLSDTCFTCPKPDLFITFDRDTGIVKDTFYATLTLRYPPNVPPQAGALGIAFDLTYDPENVKDSLTKVFPDTLPGDLMFVAATSTLARSWRTLPPGSIGFGAAGRGMNAMFFTRPLGVVAIVVDDMIIRSSKSVQFQMDVSNVLIVNELEQVVCLGAVEIDTILLLDPADATLERENWQAAVTLAPNPAADWVEVRSPKVLIENVAVTDAIGRLVFLEKTGGVHLQRLWLTGLPSGIFFIKLLSDKGWTVKPFLKIR